MTKVRQQKKRSANASACTTIPAMTERFLEEFIPVLKPLCIPLNQERHSGLERTIAPPSGGRCSILRRKTDTDGHSNTTRLPAGKSVNVYYTHGHHTSVRWFVRALSHTSNNLLMSILGNLTIIGRDPSIGAVEKEEIRIAEDVIISAANLSHLLFGYFSEQRIEAKKLQLVQLLSELQRNIQCHKNADLVQRIERSMETLAPTHERITIAGCMSGVLQSIFEWLWDAHAALTCRTHNAPSVVRRLQTVSTLLARGDRIVTELRHYARQHEPEIRRMSMRMLLKRFLNEMRGRYPQIRFDYDATPRLPWLFADPHQIRFVLDVLMSNAIDAIPKGGIITVNLCTLYDEAPQERCAVGKGADYMVLTVSDSGRGMNRSTQSLIFEPFYGRKLPRAGHHGLGLSAASGIVRSHGGYIQVRSTPRKGSTFKVYLPLRKAKGDTMQVAGVDALLNRAA